MLNLQNALNKHRRILNKSLASLVDQVTFGGANFGINVLFARWMSVTDYGIFTLAYSILLFWFFLVSALQLEPIAIFRHKNENQSGAYVTANLAITALLLVGFALLLLPVLYLFPGKGISFNPIMLLLACLSTALFWALRQFSYADNKPWMAFTQTAAYAIGLFVAAFAIGQTNTQTADGGLRVLAVGAFFAVVVGTVISRGSFARFSFDRVYSNMIANARYGAWSAPSNLAAWFAANAFLISLPTFGSPDAAARLKTLLNILLPFQQILAGVSLLFMPILARLHSNGDIDQFKRTSTALLMIGMLGGMGMSTIMYFGGSYVYTFVYGAGYAGQAGIIMTGLALPVLMAPISVFRIITRATNRPDKQLRAYLVGTVAVGLIAVPVGTSYGQAGAVIGMTLMQAATLAVMIFDNQRTRRRQSSSL